MNLGLLLSLLFLIVLSTRAETMAGIEFAQVDGTSLKLDLHRPAHAEKPPLVVYVHGGAWRAGSREDVPIAGLLEHGFAIASVDYRLSTQARFPAQIHDIKAAIRFLRATADEFHINAGTIAIIGSSAGGHLAALTGMTNGHKDLEGNVGAHLDVSSQVSAVVSFYGASNLQSILSQSTEFGLGVRVPALKLLLGDLPEIKPALARLASPVVHLDVKDPPLLMIHGDADPQMPVAQSEELQKACELAKVRSRLIIMPGSKHGGGEFYESERLGIVAAFLKQHLRQP
jgi:acetyl esterase/lipase